MRMNRFSTKCLAVKPVNIRKKKKLLDLPQELRSQTFALAMDDQFSSKAHHKTKCILYDKATESTYPTCYTRNYDAKALGLEALQYSVALRLVCKRIYEDVKTFSAPLPMLYFGSYICLSNFNKRFPRNLRPRVQKFAFYFGDWINLDEVDVRQEFDKYETSMRSRFEIGYPSVPGRAWTVEWHELTLVASR